MQAQLEAFLKSHTMFGGFIAAALGVALRHYAPQVKDWIVGPGADKLAAASLLEFKALLKEAGATDTEIKSVENLVLQVLSRITADVQKDSQ